MGIWRSLRERYERGKPVMQAQLGWPLIVAFVLAILLSVWWSWAKA